MELLLNRGDPFFEALTESGLLKSTHRIIQIDMDHEVLRIVGTEAEKIHDRYLVTKTMGIKRLYQDRLISIQVSRHQCLESESNNPGIVDQSLNKI